MGLVLQIVVGVSVLGSFALAWLSFKSVRAYNLVLAVMVLIATIVFAVFAARTLRTHEAWRSLAKAQEAELATLEQKNRDLAEGVQEKNQPLVEGIRQLKLQLFRSSIDRGGVWYEIAPEKVNPDTGVAMVSIDAPEPHGLAEKMIVFAFDPKQYLGEFQVTKAAAKSKSVELTPMLPFNPEPLARLAASVKSGGPWTLYQMMPIDDASTFASLSDEERAKLLPKSALKEFANPDRPLRNYQMIFHFNAQQQMLTQDEISRVQDNIKQMKDAKEKIAEEIKYREGEKADLQFDLKNFQRELVAVKAYAVQLQQKFENVRSELRSVFTATRQEASELATLELRAAEAINRRTDGDQADALAIAGGAALSWAPPRFGRGPWPNFDRGDDTVPAEFSPPSDRSAGLR